MSEKKVENCLPSWCRSLEENDTALVKTCSTGKVHQAIVRTRGPYINLRSNPDGGPLLKVKVPARKYLSMRCRYSSFRSDGTYITEFLSAEGEELSCKNCMASLGLIEKGESNTRFVLVNKEDNTYFKKRRWKQVWVKGLGSATLYKVRSAAVARGKRVYFYDECGSEIIYKEYNKHVQKCRASGEQNNYTRDVRFAEERFEVKEVLMNVVV